MQGEKSDSHEGQIILSDDNKTIIFKSDRPFLTSENVLVKVNAEALDISPIEYRFTISEISEYNPSIWAGTLDDVRMAKSESKLQTYGTTTVINGVAVPSDYPQYDGKYFQGNCKWEDIYFKLGEGDSLHDDS